MRAGGSLHLYKHLERKQALKFGTIFGLFGLVTLFLIFAYSRTAADWNKYAPGLRQCESGGNYSINTGNGYYGAYQFSSGTWMAYDGYKVYHYQTANLAPSNIQDLSAYHLFLNQGLGPWTCGSYALSHPYSGPADSTGSAAPTVQVIGRLWNNVSTGQAGGSGAVVDTCGYGQVTSDSNGYIKAAVPIGSGFCFHLVNIHGYALAAQGQHQPSTSITGYEYQVAGKNCATQTGCDANQVSWDRDGTGGGGDYGYDFQLTSGIIATNPPPPPPPTCGTNPAPASGTDTLRAGQQLNRGGVLRSSLGNYILALQGDGNLVIYNHCGKAIWAINKPGDILVLQGDNNLVEYTTTYGVVWASNTSGSGASSLVMQNDGNLVLYTAAGKAVWSSGTYGK